MNILLANVIVYLTRYVYFLKQFFKSKYISLFIDILKWEILAYSFSLVNGYSATLCYMFLIVYEVMKFTRVNKNLLIDAIVFSIAASFIYLSKKYNVIFLLPFLALFIQMFIKPLLKRNDNKYTTMSIDLLMCIYSFKYHLYILFIFKLFQIIFPIIGTSIKSLTDYTNHKTS